MFISKIAAYNLNLKPNFTNNFYENRNYSKFGLKMSAPLRVDTVSFGENNNNHTAGEKKNEVSQRVARDIRTRMREPHNRLKKLLEDSTEINDSWKCIDKIFQLQLY